VVAPDPLPWRRGAEAVPDWGRSLSLHPIISALRPDPADSASRLAYLGLRIDRNIRSIYEALILE